MEGIGVLVYLIGFAISVAMVLAQFRLFSIDKTLKAILVELQRGAQPGGAFPAMTEADMTQRRAAIADVQKNWPGYK
jgi:hypothetical protein